VSADLSQDFSTFFVNSLTFLGPISNFLTNGQIFRISGNPIYNVSFNTQHKFSSSVSFVSIHCTSAEITRCMDEFTSELNIHNRQTKVTQHFKRSLLSPELQWHINNFTHSQEDYWGTQLLGYSSVVHPARSTLLSSNYLQSGISARNVSCCLERQTQATNKPQ